TEQFGRTPPVASETVPRRLPVATWAQPGATQRAATRMTSDERSFIAPPEKDRAVRSHFGSIGQIIHVCDLRDQRGWERDARHRSVDFARRPREIVYRRELRGGRSSQLPDTDQMPENFDAFIFGYLDHRAAVVVTVSI